MLEDSISACSKSEVCSMRHMVRLQPHYVYTLGNSKCAVTTARHSHSTRQRLIPPTLATLLALPHRCHSPFLAPLQKNHFASSDPHQPGNLVVGYKSGGVCMHGGLGNHIVICFCRAQMVLERGSWGILEELGRAGSNRTI